MRRFFKELGLGTFVLILLISTAHWITSLPEWISDWIGTFLLFGVLMSLAWTIGMLILAWREDRG